MKKLVERALLEDVGHGDLTSSIVVPPNLEATGRVSTRESLVLSGTDVFREVVAQVDKRLELKTFKKDGDFCLENEPILALRGSARSILIVERTGLNFLMRLSGVATLTREFADAMGPDGPKLLDTRKTTPGL
ncbi:MAG: nicotinate-nucleotide diphosphorylase (carboxylating), partial [Deltaproteobacteria bacterium]|nr:nicotinate-nucleotide diphosphorylase (carboxylating) [Deltaproteobacteria bacterium]